MVNEAKVKALNASDKNIAFQTLCYLGRYNGIFHASRQLVQISSHRATIELGCNKENSLCCGGGGGGMSFIDEPAEKLVSGECAREILATKANTLAVGCPFCLTMMEDGIKSNKGEGRDLQVKDISEILFSLWV